ncbi:hypothetical protein C7974DRAFT_384414 [Boeremia exigua]|uniref:uncharacterized protein n=1 Tax=Boeremia exigua TaxID=749465 RepID=UPI001E8D47C7|nr:uncharacterized protein C7974DRAFT_384414 [Boeremia exigua]KAH6644864.1 hypothetical protein C7974DRAFT_384414 [Boeremia exigua]
MARHDLHYERAEIVLNLSEFVQPSIDNQPSGSEGPAKEIQDLIDRLEDNFAALAPEEGEIQGLVDQASQLKDLAGQLHGLFDITSNLVSIASIIQERQADAEMEAEGLDAAINDMGKDTPEVAAEEEDSDAEFERTFTELQAKQARLKEAIDNFPTVDVTKALTTSPKPYVYSDVLSDEVRQALERMSQRVKGFPVTDQKAFEQHKRDAR